MKTFSVTQAMLISATVAVASFLLANCSGTPEKHQESTAADEQPFAEEECIVWSHDDSVAMETIYIANAYIFDGHLEKAEVLYKYVSTLQHDLPGIALHAGLLIERHDTLAAKAYFEKETRQDLRILESRIPDCRKYEFLVTLHRCYRLLGEPEKAASALKKYRKVNNGQASMTGQELHGNWSVYP